MLTIGIMASGQHEYYLSKVAQGWEDYYSREAPGQWMGGSAEALGLVGEVQGADFRAVLTGRAPDGSSPLGSKFTKRTQVVDGKPVTYHPRPGYDLTFSAPKSVSVLSALGDKDLSNRVRAAHDEAVRQGMDYLTRTVSYGRRGRDGVRQIETAGFLAAAFRHRTSREGDPQLHTHVIVANKVLGVDGRWTAVDSKAIHYQAKTAGTIYQAVLRDELSDLGLEWDLHEHGYAELCCVPKNVRREFSQRRRQIEAEAAKRGVTSGQGLQTATYATRPAAMGTAEDGIRLEWEWINRAKALGFSREDINLALAEGRQRAATVDRLSRRQAELSAAADVLLSAEGLTERSSTFDEKDMLRGLAARVPNGAGVADIERAAKEALTSDRVVAVSGRDADTRRKVMALTLSRQARARAWVPIGGDSARYTTVDLLALEQALVDSAVEPGAPVAQASEEAVAGSLAAHPHLAGEAEQVEMVRHLCLSGREVDVVNAPGGSGKTLTLGAATKAWQDSGVHVIGATLAAKAAGVLADETGMSTFTIARLKGYLTDERTGLAPGSVLVVDEAGQVGTRDLWTLRQAVKEAGGKLVLVGDNRQLPEIDAGGAFKGLIMRLPTVRLTKNRRQLDDGERGRLRQLRAGDVAAAMRSYDEAGRVHRAETSEDLRRGMAVDWSTHWLAGRTPQERSGLVMLGLTNADVEDLNERARVLLEDAGVLSGPEVTSEQGRAFRVGDQVVSRLNKRRLGVLNGYSWVVTGLDPDTRAVTVQRITKSGLGKQVTLPHWYIDGGHLQHGYAITVAISQGSTSQRAWVLGSDATSREAGYVAASRARERTDWYVVAPSKELDCCDQHGHACETGHPEQIPFGFHVQATERDPLDELVTALSRSRWQPMATDTPEHTSPQWIGGGTRLSRQMSAQEMRDEAAAIRSSLRRQDPPKTVLAQWQAARRQLDKARAAAEQARVAREHAQEMLDAAASARTGVLRRPDRQAVADAEKRVGHCLSRERAWESRVSTLEAEVDSLTPDVDYARQWADAHAAQLARLEYLEQAIPAHEAEERRRDRAESLDIDL